MKKQVKRKSNNKKKCHKDSSPCFQVNFKKIIRNDRDLIEARKEYV